jgi:glycosyltransferase involved in cell wall biosynthesis
VLNVQTVDEILGAMVALTDQGLRRKLGEQARDYVTRHHSPQSVARQYVELYKEVLE